MNKILILLIFGFLLQNANAQTGLLSGKVVDKEQHFSLPGANLKLLNTNHYTISNQDGSYAFLGVPAGKYQMLTTYLGYTSDTTNITIQNEQNLVINISLNSGAILGQEIIVLGDRLRGQAKALNQQKNNKNITNIVSSDQIGRFPDANIGDALKRIPGITMQNDQGEARDIIIRGLAPELNSVTLNGSRIPSAEGDNRRVQMDLIPSDMIQTIEVNKTLTSDMDADAIGGSVNLVTRTAPNQLRISGTLSSGYNPIRDKALYTGSAVAANRFLDKKLGAVLSLSYNNNNYGSDNLEYKYKENKTNNQIYISEQDIRKYNVHRIRRSISLGLDYKFNAKNSLFLTGIYNWRNDWENRFRLDHQKIKPNSNDELFTGTTLNQTKGGVNNGRNRSTRLEDQRIRNIELRGQHLLGESIAFDWDVAYSKASENRPNERYISWMQSKIQFQQNGNLLVNNALNYDPAKLILSKGHGKTAGLSQNHNYTDEGELSTRLNFRLPLNLIPNQKGRLRFGYRMRLKTKMRNNKFYEYTPTNTNTLFQNIASTDAVDITDTNFQPGNYPIGIITPASFLGNLDLNNSDLFNKIDNPTQYLTANYHAKENIYAGYIRQDQDITNQLSLISGLRMEQTQMSYSGAYVQEKGNNIDANLTAQRTINSNYTNWLPNIALRYAPNNEVILRTAFSTSIARPNYYDLTPFVNSIDGDNEIKAGNPNLKAAYAFNYDFMAEKYFKSVGILSGGVFAKKINHFIYQYISQNYFKDDFAKDFPSFSNPIENDQNWTFQQARNGESVNVYGFEVTFQRQLDFLPGILKNFGIYANYTFTRSKAKGISDGDGNVRKNVSLPGTAPNMYNLSLSYEDKKLTLRVSSNFANAYLDELGDSKFNDSYYGKQFFLDANATYKITPKFRLFAEANNLTNLYIIFKET